MAKSKEDAGFKIFDRLYADPKSRQDFKDYLKNVAHTEELLDFIEAIDRVGPSTTLEGLKKMSEDYIAVDAPSQVNISQTLRDDLQKSIKRYMDAASSDNKEELQLAKQGMVKKLKEANKEIKRLIIQDSMPRYLKYQEEMQTLKKSLSDMRSEIIKDKLDDAGGKAVLDKIKEVTKRKLNSIEFFSSMDSKERNERFDRAYELAIMDSYMARKGPEASKKSASRFGSLFGMANVGTNYQAMQKLKTRVKEIYDRVPQGGSLSSTDLEHLEAAYSTALIERTGRNPGQAWELVQKRQAEVRKALGIDITKKEVFAPVDTSKKKREDDDSHKLDMFRR